MKIKDLIADLERYGGQRVVRIQIEDAAAPPATGDYLADGFFPVDGNGCIAPDEARAIDGPNVPKPSTGEV